MSIDYRDLLRRYIAHVEFSEGGHVFLSDDWLGFGEYSEDDERRRARLFSPDEVAQLRALAGQRYVVGQIIEIGGRRCKVTKVEGSIIDTEPLD
jgi:hypothetical protein